MTLSPQILQSALSRLKADFGRNTDVAGIQLSAMAGSPVILVTGHRPTPPPLFPPGIRINTDKGPVTLPIVWRMKPPNVTPIKHPTPEQDLQLDLDMWGGAPPITDHPMKLWSPQTSLAVGANKDQPKALLYEHQLSVEARLPQFVTPNFWARPFRESGHICLLRYATVYDVVHFQVPSDYSLIIDGLSYEFSDLVPFDQFDIRVLKNGAPLQNGTFRDMRAPTASVDPAEQYCFAGHYRPIPFYGRFDHDETMTLQVIVWGQYPFTKTPLDPLGGCVFLFAKGWLGSLYDNRDGGARPVDMGELNDWALGDGRP